MCEYVDLLRVFDQESSLYEAYTNSARDELSSNTEFGLARDEWQQFIVESHGKIFDELSPTDPVDSLFVDSMYYDFVIDQIIEFVQGEFEVTLINRDPGANTGAVSHSYHRLHESLIDTTKAQRAIEAPLRDVDLEATGTQFLRDLYETILPSEFRLALGEYYTPAGVSELAVESLGIDEYESESFLDPGCGSGVFLEACIEVKCAELDGLSPDATVQRITETVYGIDLNPVAVKSSKLSYLLSLAPLLVDEAVDSIEVPVFLTDSLGLTRESSIQYDGHSLSLTVDHLVGNPPWLTWETLSESVQEAWKETSEKLDLVPHTGAQRRLGHANDDISVSFVWVCLDRYLEDSGDASFVLKREITKGPAGRLLRTQEVGSQSVAVIRIHDFNQLRPFGEDVDTNAAIYTFQLGAERSFPVPTISWESSVQEPAYESLRSMRQTLHRTEQALVPVRPDTPSSSWIRADTERRVLGSCDHDIRHGLKDDAKDVYSIQRTQLDSLEEEHIYPYLRSKHVVKYGLFGHDLHLVPMNKTNQNNEQTLRSECPKTHAYLDSHRERLNNRSSSWLSDGPFYNLFGLGEYTWSAYKVVWCRLGFKPHFAVVSTVDDQDIGEKIAVPGDHFMFISTADRMEAHFLCALLNSAPYQKTLREISSDGKSSLSKETVSKLALPLYPDDEDSRRLAELSIRAHEIVPEYTDVSKRQYNEMQIDELESVQSAIDTLVERLLSDGIVGSTDHNAA